MAEATDKENQDALINEIQKKITDAFDIFDHEANKTVDVREVGTIIRSLGCCPSEAELQDILAEVEEEEPTGYIRFDKFLPMMTKILVERKFRPVSEEEIIQAFKVLDVQNKGYLTQEELAKCMTEEGEPFTADELDEMMSQALDPERGYIPYKEYAYLMIDEDT